MIDEKVIEETFPAALKVLCDAYDKEYGEFPKNMYEGRALYKFYQKITPEKL